VQGYALNISYIRRFNMTEDYLDPLINEKIKELFMLNNKYQAQI